VSTEEWPDWRGGDRGIRRLVRNRVAAGGRRRRDGRKTTGKKREDVAGGMILVAGAGDSKKDPRCAQR